jgi:hypothetical protein
MVRLPRKKKPPNRAKSIAKLTCGFSKVEFKFRRIS